MVGVWWRLRLFYRCRWLGGGVVCSIFFGSRPVLTRGVAGWVWRGGWRRGGGGGGGGWWTPGGGEARVWFRMPAGSLQDGVSYSWTVITRDVLSGNESPTTW